MNTPILIASLLFVVAGIITHIVLVQSAYWRGYETRRTETPTSETHGLALLPAVGADYAHDYAQGYKDGYAIALQKAQAEHEASAVKHFQRGYNQCLTDMAAEMQTAEAEVAAGLTVDLRLAGAN